MNVRTPNQTGLGTNVPATSSAAMVAKSIVCVAMVAGLAWIGMSSVDNSTATAAQAGDVAAGARVAVTGDRAAAHRREVFEERRARYLANSPKQVAGGNLEYSAP